MPKYIIQKSIDAKNMREALQNEKKGILQEIWREKETEKSSLTPAIGFQEFNME